jgi:hypothetical protein
MQKKKKSGAQSCTAAQFQRFLYGAQFSRNMSDDVAVASLGVDVHNRKASLSVSLNFCINASSFRFQATLARRWCCSCSKIFGLNFDQAAD